MTRDQLRAARILLHLNQPELAGMAKMGVATLRRYEGGQYVGEIYADSLQRVIERMGVVFLAEEPSAAHDADQSAPAGATQQARPRLGLGIALRPHSELPEDTIKRLDAASKQEKEAKASPGTSTAGGSDDTEAAPPKKGRGRPKKGKSPDAGEGAAPDSTADQLNHDAPTRRGRPKGKRGTDGEG